MSIEVLTKQYKSKKNKNKNKTKIYTDEMIMTQRAENEKIKIHLKSNTYVLLLD